MNKNRPTMQDIAKRAGVSTATVCRILNQNVNSAISTRERVKRVAEELGYHYKARHDYCDSNVIIIVAECQQMQYQYDVLKGIQQQAERQGYQLLIFVVSANSHNIINYIARSPVCGAIFLNHGQKLTSLQQQVADLIPTLLVNSMSNSSNVTAIHLDYLTSAYQATTYLQKLGHHYIASIGGYNELITTQHLEQGYQLALKRHNIAVNKHFIINCNMSAESAINALNQLMSLPHHPSALLCHNDELALGILFQAKQKGLLIPNDLSVISISDSKLAQFITPSLTCIKNPLLQLGKLAVKYLINHLTTPNIKQLPTLIGGELIIGCSTSEFH